MKNTILFFIFLSILNFSSCTIAGTHYLVNQTGEDLTIKLEFEHKGYSQFLKIRTKKYKRKRINFRKKEKMDVIETIYNKADNSIEFVLGKDEYAFIGRGRNYYFFLGIKNITAKGENTFIELKDLKSNKIENPNVEIEKKSTGFLSYALIAFLING